MEEASRGLAVVSPSDRFFIRIMKPFKEPFTGSTVSSDVACPVDIEADTAIILQHDDARLGRPDCDSSFRWTTTDAGDAERQAMFPLACIEDDGLDELLAHPSSYACHWSYSSECTAVTTRFHV